jgi:hypothetical protein
MDNSTTVVEFEAQREYSNRPEKDEWCWMPVSHKPRYPTEKMARDRLQDQATNRWTRAYRVVKVTTTTLVEILP